MTQSKKKETPASWRHYNFTTAGPVDDYLYSMLPKRDDVLAEMEDYATEHDVPIVGPAVARVLQQLALMINAQTVFELGSAIGYSTIWWAQAVGREGPRHLHRRRLEKRRTRSRLFRPRRRLQPHHAAHRRCAGIPLRAEAGIRHHLQRRRQRRLSARVATGCAAPAQRRTCSLPTTCCGAVVSPRKYPTDARTKAILEFNRKLYDSKEFYTTILPIRDGLAVAIEEIRV